jgi:hypothetical protein
MFAKLLDGHSNRVCIGMPRPRKSLFTSMTLYQTTMPPLRSPPSPDGASLHTVIPIAVFMIIDASQLSVVNIIPWHTQKRSRLSWNRVHVPLESYFT